MSIAKVLNRNAIVLDLDARDKKDVIDLLSDRLLQDGAIASREEFIADVYLRETEGKTGIGNGVAIPHGKSAAVIRTCVAIGRTRAPIAWESIDGGPVRLVILFAANPSEKGMTFIKMLQGVARIIAHDEACEALMRARSVEEVAAVFAT